MKLEWVSINLITILKIDMTLQNIYMTYILDTYIPNFTKTIRGF